MNSYDVICDFTNHLSKKLSREGGTRTYSLTYRFSPAGRLSQQRSDTTVGSPTAEEKARLANGLPPKTYEKEKGIMLSNLLEALPDLVTIDIDLVKPAVATAVVLIEPYSFQHVQDRVINSIIPFGNQLTSLKLVSPHPYNFDTEFLATFLSNFISLKYLAIERAGPEKDQQSLCNTLKSLPGLLTVEFRACEFIDDVFLTTLWCSNLLSISFFSTPLDQTLVDLSNLNFFLSQFKLLESLTIELGLDSDPPHAEYLPHALPSLQHLNYEGQLFYLSTFQPCPLLYVTLTLWKEDADTFIETFKTFLDQHLLLKELSFIVSEYQITIDQEESLQEYLVEKGRGDISWYIER